MVMGQNLTAQTEVKKPKEVFQLFFDTFLKNDEASRVKLNDYLRPTVEGQDAYQVNFKETSEETLKTTTEGFLSIFPKAAAKACQKDAEEYVRLMFENFRKGQLMIKSVKVVPNEYLEGEKIAELTYTVSFKVPSHPPAQPSTDPKKVKPEELKKYLSDLIEGFKNADKTIMTDQEFSLYELKQDGKIYYWNGSPDQIVTNLTDFYFDSF
ncbi:hypothetical protein CW752_15165 [Chryseobacterium sp. PMSZPI]|nr:hypothetical protein CW752_15165 [Chryseobacterium sp. PMSZPI]